MPTIEQVVAAFKTFQEDYVQPDIVTFFTCCQAANADFGSLYIESLKHAASADCARVIFYYYFFLNEKGKRNCKKDWMIRFPNDSYAKVQKWKERGSFANDFLKGIGLTPSVFFLNLPWSYLELKAVNLWIDVFNQSRNLVPAPPAVSTPLEPPAISGSVLNVLPANPMDPIDFFNWMEDFDPMRKELNSPIF